jgi:hypothetical protein
MRAKAKRRVALSLLAAAAVTGSLAIAGAPAYGQSAGVGNSGQASANSGGNGSVGNNSLNDASTDSFAETPTDSSLVGGLLGLVLNVGNTSNQSSGSSTIETGGAAASGNNSDTSVAQAGGGATVVGTPFGPVVVGGQSAGVSNSGSAQANTGGNESVGNNSENIARNTQTVSGGLLAAGINIGNVSNQSDGSSDIATGDALASGNEATTAIEQASIGAGFKAGGGFACDGLFRFGGQHVEVRNAGSASANTGNNAGVGNQSTNVASNNQTVSGGLIGLGVNLLGNTTNDSDGTSSIGTGTAEASGNRSTTQVIQEECVVPAQGFHPPVITPHVVKVKAHVGMGGGGELAKTGVDPFVMGLVAFILLFGGLLFLVWERVEAMPPGRVA